MEQGGEEWRVVLVFQVANKYIFPGKQEENVTQMPIVLFHCQNTQVAEKASEEGIS